MQDNESRLQKKDGQPVRYLVVDDSVFARKHLGRILEMLGGVVAGEAVHGLAAIEEYNLLLPDVVLMDVTMPEMEGFEAAERIIRNHPQARIVMVSSLGDQENISQALRIGVLHFVQKPARVELLQEVLRRVLGAEGKTVPAATEGRQIP